MVGAAAAPAPARPLLRASGLPAPPDSPRSEGPSSEWHSTPLAWSCSELTGASRVAQLLARAGLCWARVVRARPRVAITFGLLLALVAAAGNLAPAAPDATLLDAWLPPNTYRQRNKELTEATWGAQRLDQIIIRPRDGNRWTRGRSAGAHGADGVPVRAHGTAGR